MDIWIPEPLYRAFPKMNMLVGMLFGITSGGKVSMVLSLALVCYGAWMATARAVGK